MHDILAAMHRYNMSGVIPPRSWVIELDEHTAWLADMKKQKEAVEE